MTTANGIGVDQLLHQNAVGKQEAVAIDSTGEDLHLSARGIVIQGGQAAQFLLREALNAAFVFVPAVQAYHIGFFR